MARNCAIAYFTTSSARHFITVISAFDNIDSVADFHFADLMPPSAFKQFLLIPRRLPPSACCFCLDFRFSTGRYCPHHLTLLDAAPPPIPSLIREHSAIASQTPQPVRMLTIVYRVYDAEIIICNSS